MNTRSVYKYPLAIKDTQFIHLSADYRPLLIGVQAGHLQTGQLCLWAEITVDAPTILYPVHIYGTGHPITTGGLTHLGSAQMGSFVWHVYIEDLGRVRP